MINFTQNHPFLHRTVFIAQRRALDKVFIGLEQKKFMLENAERFFKVYSGLPFEERKLPIVVIENQPVNWDLAYEEITNETDRGKKILKLLIELEVI